MYGDETVVVFFFFLLSVYVVHFHDIMKCI